MSQSQESGSRYLYTREEHANEEVGEIQAADDENTSESEADASSENKIKYCCVIAETRGVKKVLDKRNLPPTFSV